MSELFLNLFNRSTAAIWLILAVMALRLVLKKAPKTIHCLLWAVVGLRLALPISIPSVLSLVPSAQIIHPEYLERNTLQVSTGIHFVNSRVNDYLGDHYYAGVTVPSGFLDHLARYSGVIWITGMAAMALWFLLSWYKLKKQVAEAIPEGNRIYRCDCIDSPFVLGMLRPKIYLPNPLSPADASHVIAHERTHIRRRDHWWKPLGFLLLTIHWFNPMVWAAYVLLCRDIELACDERVIRELGEAGKTDYSRALLNCASRGRAIAACPLAFGEVDVKRRVRNVLYYKRPAFWVLAASLVICAVVAVCFLTDPQEGIPDPVSDLTAVEDHQDQVKISNPLSSAWPRIYTDPVVVERIYNMFQNLTWREATEADEKSRNLQTWLSVELVHGGQRRSMHIDRSGVGNLYDADGNAYNGLPTLKFDQNTYDFDYLWLLYNGSHEAADEHTDNYTGGALLCQSLALSFLPTDGSGYAGVTESGTVLTIRGRDGEILFLGSRVKEKSYDRGRAISAYSFPQYDVSGLDSLLPENTEAVTIRIYENDVDHQFSIWQVDFEDGKRWLWLAEGGETPLRIYELINVDETFQFGAEGYLWTHSLSTPTLPVRFEGDFVSAAVTVEAGTVSLKPPMPQSSPFLQPESSITINPGDTVYWLFPGGDASPERARFSYTLTDASGKIYEDYFELRKLSLAKSLHGNVTYGITQDWLGWASSQLHLTKLSISEDLRGFTVTLDGLLHSSSFSSTVDSIHGVSLPTDAKNTPAQ